MSQNLSQEEIDSLLKKGPESEAPAKEKEKTPVSATSQKRKAAPDASRDASSPDIQPAVFSEISKNDPLEVPVAGMEVLLDVPLSISVELGRARCFVKDLLNLSVGSVVELDKAAGESVDVLVNGKVFAHGEVVVVDENFGVRINDIVSKSAIDKGARKITQ